MTNTACKTLADLYLRLSDFRVDDADSFPARVAKLRVRAADLGWAVHRVIIENDRAEDGRRKPASAYKRQRVTGPDGRPLIRYGRPVYRVLRPGWQQVLTDLGTGAARAVLAEDLDRVARDPRDIEDLIDAVAACGGHARSLSGSLTLTEGGSSDQLAMARVMVTMAAKSSADTARRVADSRERLAGQSYQGGRRPFGYRPDPDAPPGAKTLLADEAEAGVIRQAAADILDRGISLKAIARDLREAGVPTVTGAPWTASTLRDVLSKPAVAGIAVHTATVKDEETGGQRKVTTEHPGAWPAILPRDQWERLRDLFDGRKTGTSPEPRWLLSGYATCGKNLAPEGEPENLCGAVVKCTGSASRRAYTCTAHGHVRRAAAAVDKRVSALVVERLSRPDAADLLRPPPRPGIDAAALRGEAKRLRAKSAKMGALFAADAITEAQLTSGTREIRARLARIDAQLAASDAPDPLAEFRGRPAAEVWESLSLPRRRAVIRLLMTVTILPAARKGNRFDPDSLRIVPLA
jgi:site-specific DNA recombinase